MNSTKYSHRLPEKKRIAYADCFSGINGTMFLAALVDAGLSAKDIQEGLERMNLHQSVAIEQIQTQKGSLRALSIAINVSESIRYRFLSEIEALYSKCDLPSSVKDYCINIYQLLAEAEAHVHGATTDMVSFHEVGNLRAIIRTTLSVWGLHVLGIHKLYSSALPFNQGMVDSEHGRLPLPAPATLEIMRMAKIPLTPSKAETELVSPSGAALLAILGSFDTPTIIIEKTGMGAGSEDLPWPNVLRLFVGTEHVLVKPELQHY